MVENQGFEYEAWREKKKQFMLEKIVQASGEN